MHGRLIRVNADNNPSDTKGINKSFNNDDNHYINNTVMLRNTTKRKGRKASTEFTVFLTWQALEILCTVTRTP